MENFAQIRKRKKINLFQVFYLVKIQTGFLDLK